MTEHSYELRYLVMPNFVYKDNRLSDVSRRVYCFIHTYEGPKFFFGNENLSKMFNCSEWSITQAITQLKELKYIDTSYVTKGEGGKIRFVIDLMAELRDGVLQSSELGFSNSRKNKDEAPTLGKPKHNVFKDNNLKSGGKPIVNTPEEVEEQLGESDSLKERREAKLALRAKKINSFLKSSFRPSSSADFSKTKYEKKRGGVAYYGKD